MVPSRLTMSSASAHHTPSSPSPSGSTPSSRPAAVPAAGMLAISPFLGPFAGTFFPAFLLLVCMSQQFHAWSHMKKSQLPSVVVALQDFGLLIGRRQHGAHHRPNFEGNYCIVSGLWNAPLDAVGFFRGLEKLVAALTGVEPRCWYAPEAAWQEMTLEASMSLSSAEEEGGRE